MVAAWRRGAFRRIVTDAIREAYDGVLHRPELLSKYGASGDDSDHFRRLVAVGAASVVAAVVLPLSVPNPNDEPIPAAAIGGDADSLETRDEDLPGLAGDPRLGRLRIVTVVYCLAVSVLRTDEEAVTGPPARSVGLGVRNTTAGAEGGRAGPPLPEPPPGAG